MKVLVLSGFLGAGKTSLLLQLARYLAEEADRKEASTRSEDKQTIVIIENEIGKVSIDGAALAGIDFQVHELISGCVCCTLVGELSDTMRAIAEGLDVEWVIVEATGLAFPDKTVEAIWASEAPIESVRTIVLVDASRFITLDKVSPLIGGQLGCADVILLNKVDLIDDNQAAVVINRIHQHNTVAEILSVIATDVISNDRLERIVSVRD